MTILKITERVAVGCLLLASSVAVGAAGDFDPTFNLVGFTRDSLADGSIGNGLAIHSTGEIVTAGHYFTATDSSLVLWRHLPDGQLDTAFGDNGIVYPTSSEMPWPISANSLAIDNSDRIVLLTTSAQRSFLVFRFNFDGSPDLTFAGSGSTSVPVGGTIYAVTGVAIEPDNKIVGVGGPYNPATGHVEFFVFRLQENGEPDPSFAGTGYVFTAVKGEDRATGVAIQPDGKIVVAGRARSLKPEANYDFALVRYLSNGELDDGFGDGGRVTFPVLDDNLGRKVVVQPDGKIVIAGYACEERGTDPEYCYFGVARVDAAGVLDPSFGGTGALHTEVGDGFPYDVALQADGKIVAVGIHKPEHSDQFTRANSVLVRYQPDGTLDTLFGVNGISETNFGYVYSVSADVRIQSDGKIVVAGITRRADGHAQSAVTARYLADTGRGSTLGTMPLGRPLLLP